MQRKWWIALVIIGVVDFLEPKAIAAISLNSELLKHVQRAFEKSTERSIDRIFMAYWEMAADEPRSE